MATFESIPILDYSLSRSPSTKQQFLDELKHALLQTGFLYLSNTGIDETLLKEVEGYCKRFFELPEEEKRRLEMKNSPHFLGYSRLGNEM
jgi:isopenicillin N synthase-like dioxygenase